MIEIKPPNFFPSQARNVFLAGSIEMGVAEQWQSRLAAMLEDVDCTLLNPRRDDWDSSWEQLIDNPKFREQVNWELRGLESSDIIVFYFDPNTMSPITLMELGYAAGLQADVVVCCPEGFWRKGNVDILGVRCGFHTVNKLEDIAHFVKQKLA